MPWIDIIIMYIFTTSIPNQLYHDERGCSDYFKAMNVCGRGSSIIWIQEGIN